MNRIKTFYQLINESLEGQAIKASELRELKSNPFDVQIEDVRFSLGKHYKISYQYDELVFEGNWARRKVECYTIKQVDTYGDRPGIDNKPSYVILVQDKPTYLIVVDDNDDEGIEFDGKGGFVQFSSAYEFRGRSSVPIRIIIDLNEKTVQII